MKFTIGILISLFLSGEIYAATTPEKLYTNIYDGVLQDVEEGRVTFFRKGTNIVSFDWESKQEKEYTCNLTLNDFYIVPISKDASVYLITKRNGGPNYAWILERTGICFKVSDLVPSFPSDYISIWDQVYFSEKLRLVVVPSSDYKIAPTDGRINVFIDPKNKSIVRKSPGYFYAGTHPIQNENSAFSIDVSQKQGQQPIYFLDIFNTDTFTLEKSVTLGNTNIHKFYFEESKKVGLDNKYLITGSSVEPYSSKYFIGYYDQTHDIIIKKFDNPCFEVKFYLDFNLNTCFSTPPGGPRTYYTQDLNSGELSTIWEAVPSPYEPIVSKRNSLIIANLHNGHFSFYNIQSKKTLEFYTGAVAGDFFALDRNEENIITVSANWSGVITVTKIPINNPTQKNVLYELNIPKGDDFHPRIDNERNKLFITLRSGGAYYLDL